MNRPRKHKTPYPDRCYPKDGALYHVQTQRVGTKPNGKAKYKNIWRRLGPLTDLPACYKKLADLLDANAPAKTIQTLWEKYQREVLHRLAKKTQQNRRNDMKWPLKVFGPVSAQKIEPHHIWTYWRDRGETEQARHEIRALSALLTFARQCGARSTDNPCFDLKLPGAKPRTLYVTDGLFYAVHDVAPPMIQHAMELAWCAGLDEGTIIKLERRDITSTGLIFDRSKTGKAQQIDGEDLVAILKSALALPPQVRRFVICTRTGKAYSANGFQTAWQRSVRRAIDLKRLTEEDRYHFHDLRAKGGSEAASDEAASHMLGHGDPGVTVRHYRRLPRRSEAIKIFKGSAS